MNHAEQIVHLASEAADLEEDPANAAALLIDTAACVASGHEIDLEQLVDRLRRSHTMFVAAGEAVDALPGNSALLRQ